MAWNHPFGRAATFALVALCSAAAVHDRHTAFDAFGALIGSTGGWAVSLIKWPPNPRRQ